MRGVGGLQVQWYLMERLGCLGLYVSCSVIYIYIYIYKYMLAQRYDFGDGYVPKPVIWQAWRLHLGILGHHGTIQGPRSSAL